MTDTEAIEALFFDAIETFPLEMREAAKDWLIAPQAAFQLISELETKGLSALLDK